MDKACRCPCNDAKSFLKPRLDLISRYRWRGFGKDLMGGDVQGDDARFDDAFSNLLDGDFQEWALGMELTFPNGFRQAHAGVQNAMLRLARERAILGEQERQILHDLGNSFADMKRAYAIVQTNFNRRVAAQQELDALQEHERRGDKVDWDQLLDSWRRVTDAEVQLHHALVEYVMAVKNIHVEKGSLMDYNQIQYAENCRTGFHPVGASRADWPCAEAVSPEPNPESAVEPAPAPSTAEPAPETPMEPGILDSAASPTPQAEPAADAYSPASPPASDPAAAP